jgi:hypothetical protein
MKAEINATTRQMINEVNEGHEIYTKLEVENLLWTLLARQTEILRTIPEPTTNDAMFTKEQVRKMLYDFGVQKYKDLVEYIANMETEIDTDQIEMDDDEDFDIEVNNLRLSFTYCGLFKYNGDSPSEIVARDLENQIETELFDDDATLFLNNELSKKVNAEVEQTEEN